MTDNEQINKGFEELQERMEEKARIYKDTKLDPFYQFCIGELDFKDCVEQVSINLESEINSIQK